jgi:hypothetical protein
MEAAVVRVNFTADDVARTRFSLRPAPLVETAVAMIELRRGKAARGPAAAASWLGEARAAFPATARPLLELLGPRPPWPDFWGSVAGDLEEGLDVVRATPRTLLRSDLSIAYGNRPGRPPAWLRALADGDREALEIVVRALRDLHDAVIAPRWDSVLSGFSADIARRMPLLAAGGTEALFGTLHPQLRWRDGGLDRQGVNGEHQLRGAGIVLLPSAFWTGPPSFCFGNGEHSTPILMYAALPNGHAAARDRGITDPAGPDSLAALLGPTRAAVLRTLREPLGTVDLAATVRISPASASEHAKVLRDANLIETRREGRSVKHSLTSLGAMILGYLG